MSKDLAALEIPAIAAEAVVASPVYSMLNTARAAFSPRTSAVEFSRSTVISF